MAYPISETFASGIPTDFATVIGSGLTATYDSSNEAVTLAAYQNPWQLWRLDAAPLSNDFFVEFDLEFIADPVSTKHFGFWLLTGNGFEGYRFSIQNYSLYNFKLSRFDAAGGEVALWTALNQEDHPLNARKLWRMDYQRTAGGTKGRIVASVGGVPILQCVDVALDQVRPAVFAYGVTVRLHGVNADAGSAWPYQAPAAHGFAAALARRNLGAQGNQPGPPATRGLLPALGRRNVYQGGNGRQRGTVAQKGTPTNAPLHRRVRLLEEATYLLVGETWSDAVTGAYDFPYIDPTRKYTVIGQDHTGAFRAVIADGQVPELMP